MKTKSFFIALALIASIGSCKRAEQVSHQDIISSDDKNSFNTSATFIHPGITLNKQELDLIKSQVNAKIQPRDSGWNKLRSSPEASLLYANHARSIVIADGNSSGGFTTDANAMLAHALQWYVTGNPAHATKCIEMMNAWSSKLTQIQGFSEYPRQNLLVAAWVGAHFAEAGEIIRHTTPANTWLNADIVRYENMLKTIFYPLIKNGAGEFGNWEASMINSILAIGIFTNDPIIFNNGISKFKGSGKGAVGVYIYPSGECEETCRDHEHDQMGIGELVEAAEMGWKQGIDLYSELPDPVTGLPRLAEGLEYTAKILNGVAQSSGCGTQSCSTCKIVPMWEMAYNHYHNRKGYAMDYSKKMVARSRPEGAYFLGDFAWRTLTHAELNVKSNVSYTVDNTNTGFSTSGTWTASTGLTGYYGSNYLHDGDNAANGSTEYATWTSPITTTGNYDVYMRWTAAADRPNAAPIEINYNGGVLGGLATKNLVINQTINGGTWVKVATNRSFAGGSGDYVRIFATDDGFTIADAVRWVPTGSPVGQ